MLSEARCSVWCYGWLCTSSCLHGGEDGWSGQKRWGALEGVRRGGDEGAAVSDEQLRIREFDDYIRARLAQAWVASHVMHQRTAALRTALERAPADHRAELLASALGGGG